MKSVNIRNLKHETAKIMERVSLGESVEICRRNRPVAILKPVETSAENMARPDFRSRLRAIYGETVLASPATELLASERGDR